MGREACFRAKAAGDVNVHISETFIWTVEQSPSVYLLIILLSFLYDLMHTRI